MASIIDRALAISLIRGYQAQNSAAGGPGLITPENDFLNGYFIDRQSLEAILGNPAYEGISVYLAKHPDFPDSPERIFTLAFAGAEPNPGYPAENGASPYINNGDIYEQVPYCPPLCGSL